MPGEQDIIRTCGMLAAEVPSMETLPLYGSLPKQLQDRIYHKSSNGKCIVSTNIAETSLTIPNLVFVIDSGLAKEMLWNPRVRMNQLLRVPISRFSADQRKGRAGRISDGVCIRLYTQSAFQTEFRQSTMPAIRSSRMESEVLALLCAGHRNLLGLDFLDSPDPENIASAIRELLDLRLITGSDQVNETGQVMLPRLSPTVDGRLAVQFPIAPVMFRVLESAARLECLEEMCAIVAASSQQNPIWVRPTEFADAADLHGPALFAHPLSDHITSLNAVQAYAKAFMEKKVDLNEWCLENFLSRAALDSVCTLRNRLIKLAEKRWPGCIPTVADDISADEYHVRIRKALAIGLCTQSAVKKIKTDLHMTVNYNKGGIISAESSVLYHGYDLSSMPINRASNGFPAYQWIVYDEFVSVAGKPTFSNVTVIEPEWVCNEEFMSRDRATKKYNGQLKQPKIQANLAAARQSMADTAAATASMTQVTI
ncbi:hypothetical protein PFICI_11635 [Pestalotiopsis fici W106-1]|uniref:Helicase C-terminal domain-containing protein n=1 Tax=Pestalotiopsis fici (strain W106-1 / CGMCC3.15140) TaxID=1229662 RepID=W3WQY4_PESFW|nr:uncharacterized protein PFICI_11635 [Pestalotiopsis fici W106-1]ETS76248.1 hypothetical protein PFICI_11635 [Pestalotiopsis fici W106-1]